MIAFDIAYSAEEARAFLKYRVYEILLCDIVMPKEDGIHFSKMGCGGIRTAK